MGKPRRATSSATTPAVLPFPLLEAGDHLEQATFHERYKATPSEFRAELIGGMVIVPSPLSPQHGEYHALVMGWLTNYWIATPGTQARDNATTILSSTSEPQPDGVLIIDPAYGGQTGSSEDGYAAGPPELIVEVASSSASIDLHAKRRDYEQAGVLEYVVVVLRQRAVPLHTDGCREAAQRFRDMGVEAIAIVFLHAYANPAHEQQAAAIVQEVCPHLPLSLSSTVLPVFREYEWAMATVLNASLQPLVSHYVSQLETGLQTRGIRGPLLIMQSTGRHHHAANPHLLRRGCSTTRYGGSLRATRVFLTFSRATCVPLWPRAGWASSGASRLCHSGAERHLQLSGLSRQRWHYRSELLGAPDSDQGKRQHHARLS